MGDSRWFRDSCEGGATGLESPRAWAGIVDRGPVTGSPFEVDRRGRFGPLRSKLMWLRAGWKQLTPHTISEQFWCVSSSVESWFEAEVTRSGGDDIGTAVAPEGQLSDRSSSFLSCFSAVIDSAGGTALPRSTPLPSLASLSPFCLSSRLSCFSSTSVYTGSSTLR